ncbi:hypothetical protein [Variovorax sp. PBS-H4]|uniref:hypothetical protein n=1 Tax=Variovorax sp. PBS-H4 TaxID=434008 RepID=UPI0013A54CC5|nr:hypothetical protein [Variovorax sp. PBS-H4]
MALTALVVLVVPAAAANTVEPTDPAASTAAEASVSTEAAEAVTSGVSSSVEVSDPTAPATADSESASTSSPSEPEAAIVSEIGEDAAQAPVEQDAQARVAEVAAAALAPELTLQLTQVTGTGPFDADDNPGNDSSGSNNIIRTNDTINYTVAINYEGGDQTNPVIAFTLPQGQELVSLPPFCLTGSTLTPASLGAPVIPVTTTFLPGAGHPDGVLPVADQAQGTSLDYNFLAKVRPEMPNGAAMGPITASATSDQVTTATQSNP